MKMISACSLWENNFGFFLKESPLAVIAQLKPPLSTTFESKVLIDTLNFQSIDFKDLSLALLIQHKLSFSLTNRRLNRTMTDRKL